MENTAIGSGVALIALFFAVDNIYAVGGEKLETAMGDIQKAEASKRLSQWGAKKLPRHPPSA